MSNFNQQQHFFYTVDAEKYGVNAAIILSNIRFWIKTNYLNKNNFVIGKVWTYYSARSFRLLHPYLSKDQIDLTLKKLENLGAIYVGNYNKRKYDRTKWYALTDEKEYLTTELKEYKSPESPISEKPEMHFVETRNAFRENPQPIPDIETDIETDKKKKKTDPAPVTNNSNTIDNSNAYTNKKGNDNSTDQPKSLSSSSFLINFIKAFNAIVLKSPIDQVNSLTSDETKHAEILIHGLDMNLEEWKAYVTKVLNNPFMRGQNGSNWKASFFWLIKKDNAVKVNNGTYDHWKETKQRSTYKKSTNIETNNSFDASRVIEEPYTEEEFRNIGRSIN